MHRLVHVQVLCEHSACAVQTQCRRSADAVHVQCVYSGSALGQSVRRTEASALSTGCDPNHLNPCYPTPTPDGGVKEV